MFEGALLAALCGLAAWRVFGGYARPATRQRVLAAREVAFLAAAADALYPPGGALAPSGSEAGIPAYLDGYLALVPARVRRLMRLLFLLVEQATLVFPAPGPRGRRRFSALSAAQRGAVLEGWQRSRLFPRRLVFTSLRAVLTLGYLAHPPVARALGLAPRSIPVPVCEADLLYPPVGRGREAIPFGPADLTAPSDGRPLDPDGPLHPAWAESPR
jgi:hypothetical protein